jgi:hypothetical protein
MPATQPVALGGLDATWDEPDLTQAAVVSLSKRLPPRWTVEAQPNASNAEDWDLVVKSGSNGGQSNLLVETRQSFAPRDVAELTGGLFRRIRDRSSQIPILLVAPYISPRARDLLVENDINYLDLTGNVRIALDYPGLFVVTEGAQTDPAPTTRGSRGLRGAKVGAVVRALVDACPPYTGTQLAKASSVNQGYVSRILDTLIDEGLVTRERSGPVIDADWPALLRERAAALTLFRNAGTFRYVARHGPQQLLDAIANLDPKEQPVITGSFAAVRLAPVAPPTQLVLYTTNPRLLASQLPLVEVESGADTVLIRPENKVAMSRPSIGEGELRFAAPSQVAIDCLSGSGRMPAEGEAVIEWMIANEATWRLPNIEALIESATT